MRGLLIGGLNVRSINKKSATISDILTTHKLDVLAVQETWHEGSDALSLRRAVPDGYDVVEEARSKKAGSELREYAGSYGGVAVIYRNDVKAKKLTTLPSCKTFEYVCCRLNTSRQGDVVIMSVYRPGSKHITSEFFTELVAVLESLATFRCPTLILGDFNIHLERSDDPHTCDFNDLLSSFDMLQCVTEPTHKAGGLLDVIVTRNADVVKDVLITETGVSDHALVTGRLPILCVAEDNIPVEGRKWNLFSADKFRADLVKSNLCSNLEWTKSASIDELFAIYQSELTDILDRHAPRYVRRRKRRLLTPWFDDECRQMKRRVRAFERKYRKSRDPTDRLEWITKLKEQRSLHCSKERFYWSSRINANAGDSRRLWKDLDELMRCENSTTKPTSVADAEQQADGFLNFFQQKVESVRAETANANGPVFETCGNEKFTNFQHVTVERVIHLIGSSANKQCGLDPVPTELLKKCVDLLAPFITVVFNRSLDENYVPASQKIAHIAPRLKKRGLDDSDYKNFRPVSNLSFLSKLLERIVADQLNAFLDSTGILPSFQSAYRKHHSTETALLKVFSDICKALDEGNTCILGLLDLSSAFDTVDHKILQSRLELTFGIQGAALAWLTSYLSDRTQLVRIAGRYSKQSKLLYGVPQGSVLGPLLFILYTAPLLEIIDRHGLHGHCYADDTQVYFCCPPDQMTSLAMTFSNCMSELQDWMIANRLKLNCEKTEVVWFGSRGRLRSIADIPEVTVGGSVIDGSTGARNLGVYFDEHLDMRKHINNICRQCYFQIRQLRVIRRHVTSDVLKTLLHAFVSSRLDYCNSLLFGLPYCDVRKLQSVQNAAARLLGGLSKYDHITPILRDKLHWLPIRQRVDFKIAVLTYKCLHHLAPDYLADMCNEAASSEALSRNRSAARGDLIPPVWNTVTYGQRGFQYAAEAVWNRLPANVRREQSLLSFRKQLKTHLFKTAFHPQQ